MNILVIGSGGREHALAWKISQSPLLNKLWVAPGNPGTAQHADNVEIPVDNIDEIVNFAKDNSVDLVVIGPENSLVEGLVDKLNAEGISAFGPTAEAAELEGSKAWCKELLERNRVPVASSRTFREHSSAISYVDGILEFPIVVKASGLAAGKGVVVCNSKIEAKDVISQMLQESSFGKAGKEILIEEFLEGSEVSSFCLTDGRTFIPLESCQDHKALLEGNKGPNTGGMGAVSPNFELSERAESIIENSILLPTIHGMAKEGRKFRGVLFAGIMMTAGGPKVLEYNVRFGDPETQVLMMRFASDIVPYLKACANSELEQLNAPEWHADAACTVILAAPGYPGEYAKGLIINGLDDVEQDDTLQVFHAGTRIGEEGQIETSGGRVLAVTALAPSIAEARAKAYKAAETITFEGKQMRYDIGLAAEQAGELSH